MDIKDLNISTIKPIHGGTVEQIATAVPFRVPNFPDMEAYGAVKTIVQQAQLPPMTIAAMPAVGASGAATQMAAFDPARTPYMAGGAPGTPQQGTSAVPAPIVPGDGYARIEMHSENGVLSVVGVHEVAGPLAIPGTVANGLAYEATVGDQQIGLGSVLDAGVSRSFANADVPGPEGKHHFTQRTSFNFFVRVPKAQISVAAMPNLHIALHRVANAPDRLAPGVSLLKQPGLEVAEVSRLPGIALEQLAPNVRPQLERMLRR